MRSLAAVLKLKGSTAPLTTPPEFTRVAGPVTETRDHEDHDTLNENGLVKGTYKLEGQKRSAV